MFGVHQDAVGQRTLLVATGLVRLVEQRAHLGVFIEHQAIEVSGQGFATGFQKRDSGFDQGALLRSHHAEGSLGINVLSGPGDYR
ncbi:hypothetical protein D9M68_745690 [compost metagenome]